MSGSGTSKATSTPPIQTKTDTMFEATKHLLTTASWLESGAKVMEECIKMFCDNQSSRSLISKRSKTFEEVYRAFDLVRADPRTLHW